MQPLKVIARFKDGGVLKGTTRNFRPNLETFHIEPGEGQALPVRLEDLKALFVVRTFEGDPGRSKSYQFDPSQVCGLKLEVEFADGETILGVTNAYDPSAAGFFMVPADPGGNNERVFVVRSATREIRRVPAGAGATALV